MSGTWQVTNSMMVVRENPTATLLPNGKVLVAGGYGNSAYLSSAELYEPTLGTWLATGTLNIPRSLHTATSLPNGKVLVVGGYGNSGWLASAELYDPATGSWKVTGTTTSPRYLSSATLLPNGKVLVAGGYFGSALPSAELYDPATGTWATISSMSMARYQHTATLLPCGKVLVVGGGGIGAILSSAELYDPIRETWAETAPLASGRIWHTATLLPNGTALVAGGYYYDGYLSSAETYDAATGAWTAAESLITARSLHTSTLLSDGRVLIVGGADVSSYFSNTEVYDVGLVFSNSWRPQITSLTSPLNLGNGLLITGSRFRGTSGGSSGNTQDSASDYPLVQLRSLESGQTMFLLGTNWSTNSFTSVPVWNFPPGWAMATVFVNGIPSTSSIVNITVPTPVAATLTDAKHLTNGAFQFSFTNNVGALFGVLATMNVSLPSSNWTALSGVTEVAPGRYQFSDPQATNYLQRFYRLRSP